MTHTLKASAAILLALGVLSIAPAAWAHDHSEKSDVTASGSTDTSATEGRDDNGKTHRLPLGGSGSAMGSAGDDTSGEDASGHDKSESHGSDSHDKGGEGKGGEGKGGEGKGGGSDN